MVPAKLPILLISLVWFPGRERDEMDICHPEWDKDIADIHLSNEGNLGDLYAEMQILSAVDLRS